MSEDPSRRGEEVVREFPAIGKYRVRLIRSRGAEAVLDIREYIASESFEGFTRRGVRLTMTEAADLRRLLESSRTLDAPMELPPVKMAPPLAIDLEEEAKRILGGPKPYRDLHPPMTHGPMLPGEENQ